jgi:hypothetical protein
LASGDTALGRQPVFDLIWLLFWRQIKHLPRGIVVDISVLSIHLYHRYSISKMRQIPQFDLGKIGTHQPHPWRRNERSSNLLSQLGPDRYLLEVWLPG